MFSARRALSQMRFSILKESVKVQLKSLMARFALLLTTREKHTREDQVRINLG